MQRTIDELVQWSHLNRLNVNTSRTKEMVLGPLGRELAVLLTVSSTVVERVPVYKILGIMVSADLKWDDHVAAISSKAGKRLRFMKQLRKAGVSQDDLMYYYQSVVRPVLEYACPCWHSSLTKEQTIQLENVQCRALQVIFGNIQYNEVRCTIAHITFRHSLNVNLNFAEHFSRGS